MNTKAEKRLLVTCVILAITTIVLALTLVFFNPNEFVPNKDKFKVRENHDWLATTAIGEGMFVIDNLRYYPALEICPDSPFRTERQIILDYIHKYAFENEILYCYAEDGYAVVYPESNLCKVLITAPTDLSLDGIVSSGRLESENYRISKVAVDRLPECKFVIYIDSFEEFTDYEQKKLKELKEKVDTEDKINDFLVEILEPLEKFAN